jgi:hypothetical protein
MRKHMTWFIILFGIVLPSCAIMKNLDDSYVNKDIQKGIKEMSSYVDTLKSQNEDRYTYRILAMNARDMVELSQSLSKNALDSYFRRMVRRLGNQAEDLYTASSRKNAEATKSAIDEILQTWQNIETYKKPV